MYEKFKDLKEKTPDEAAEIVGKVEKDNYLAHSIRQIELAILKTQGMRYHIFTFHSFMEASKIFFGKRHSVIRLQDRHEDLSDKKVRLILAHELGHLIYNIDRLEDHDALNKRPRTDEEEIYAWKFAFSLIRMKSNEYRSDIDQRKRYIYEDWELKDMLSAIVKEEDMPEVYKALVQSLNLPEFKA